MEDASYGSFSWRPQVNRYFRDEGYASKQAARFDRVLFGGHVFACAYLVGKRKHFAGGNGFCLSDHFGVLALLDFDVEHSRSDRAVSLLRRCRAALLRLRDQAVAVERHGDVEADRVGREEAGLMRQRAAEGEGARRPHQQARLRRRLERLVRRRPGLRAAVLRPVQGDVGAGEGRALAAPPFSSPRAPSELSSRGSGRL